MLQNTCIYLNVRHVLESTTIYIGKGAHLLLLVCLPLLLHDDDEVLLALLLELRHLLLGVLQLHRHALHLLARLVDLRQTVAQLRRRIAQLSLLLVKQPAAIGA